MLNEIRHSARALLRTRGFTALAVACIGVGVAVTATIFSAVQAVLLEPLPYPDADRLVVIFSQNPGRAIESANISYADYESWREAKGFSALSIFNWTSAGFVGDQGSERINGADASANLFEVLGVQPALGRVFTAEEEVEGKNRVVLLGHALWQRYYGGDRSVIGSTVKLSGVEHTVIGIMPPSFAFPYSGEYWRPLARNEDMIPRGNRFLAGAVGRLGPEATMESVSAELAGISQRLDREFRDSNFGWAAQVVSMREDQVGDLGPALLFFFGAVGLVLLIACANVANLLLARGLGRQREIAVRLALGASRSRVIRHLLSESIVLATLGGLLGTVLTFWGVYFMGKFMPEELPAFIQLDIDATVLSFALAVSLVTGVIFGLVPALQSTRPNIHESLKEGMRNTAGARRSGLRNGLVVGEVALSVLLLIGGALTVRSLLALNAIDPGFDPRNVASVRVSLPQPSYPDAAAREQFYNQLFERTRALPRVESVGAAQGIPFSGWDVAGSVDLEGQPVPPVGQEPISHIQAVSTDFFTTMRVQMLRGRALQPTDRENTMRVAVVNEAFAAKYWPGSDVLGKRIRFGDDRWVTIVGVVRDYRHFDLIEPMTPATYIPFAQWPRSQMDLVARTSGDPALLIPEIRKLLTQIDPEVTVGRMQTLEQVMAREVAVARLQRNLIAFFAGLALLLAIIGMYGVISYNVAQRNREISIRVALGASTRDVLGLVLGEGARLTGVGVLLGLAAALLLARVMASRFWGVQPVDPVSFTAVPAIVCGIALIASWVPARRAATIQPTHSLRGE
jgi:putative ABC transport system permease protein